MTQIEVRVGVRASASNVRTCIREPRCSPLIHTQALRLQYCPALLFSKTEGSAGSVLSIPLAPASSQSTAATAFALYRRPSSSMSAWTKLEVHEKNGVSPGPCEHFNLIGGTSVGGLLALMFIPSGMKRRKHTSDWDEFSAFTIKR